MNDTFMKEKPILPLILSMSPTHGVIHAGQFPLQHCGQLFCRADQRGSDDSVIPGLPVQNFINAVGIGFGVGINAVIAFHLGAKDHKKADQAATQGTCTCRDPRRCYDSLLYRHHAGFPADVHFIRSGSWNLASAILSLRSPLHSSLPSAWHLRNCSSSRKHENNHDQPDVRVYHKHHLRPRSDFWLWPIPEMGIEGAALATGIGQALTLAIYLVVYLLRPIRVHIRKQYILPSK